MLRKNNFDLLRLLAALQVFYYHTVKHLKIANSFEYFEYYPGVIIFFTISGFLIYQSLERNEKNILIFLKNRFYRIYPALFFSTIILLVAIIISYRNNLNHLIDKKFVIWLLGQLTIFQFWTPDILRGWGVGTPNGSLWTIVVEIQFYFMIIFLYFKANKVLKLIIISIASILLNMYLKINDFGILNKILGVLIFPYMYNFILGIIFAKYNKLKEKLLDNKFWIWFIIYNICIFILKIYPEYFVSFKSLISNLILGILSLSFVYSNTDILKNFNPKIDISYGVYLYHMIFLNFFIHNFGISETRNKYLWLYVFITFIISTLSYKMIEYPIVNRIKNKIKKEAIS